MVKRASTVSGAARKKPGPVPNPDRLKSERIVLRVHPDLLNVITAGAGERGVTRSQYVEKLLIGWANMDPRRRRLDLSGKVSESAMHPHDTLEQKPLEFNDRWKKFCEVSVLLTGFEPPKQWFEDFSDADLDAVAQQYIGDVAADRTPNFTKKKRK